MAKKGHEIDLILLIYNIESEFSEFRNGITWHSVNLLPNPFHYFFYVKSIAKKRKADWIIGFSDTYFGICAQIIAEKTNMNSAIDAYDNYESYMKWNKVLHFFWRRALNKCDLVTAAGPELLNKLLKSCHYSKKKRAGVISMSADSGFSMGNKSESRERLGLPNTFFLVGYSGSLNRNRDIHFFLEAIKILEKTTPEIKFVLTGRKQTGLRLPDNIFWLGYIPDNMVVDVYRSVDVLISINADSEFGNYSYPVKIYEALACGTPILATSTESTKYVLKDYPEAFFQPGSTEEIVSSVQRFYKAQYTPEPITSGWEKQGDILEDLLLNSRS
ncbi:MAG: glycosyltransferase [gamma proteobacterium symbiont of Lucinoma myriamae]|nr:glycosyltransferase [gamma proteobacterium symbiont of Lucinoma myriamae]MCU7819643.1 glycosyltransferase [gamma proteobacterium symbiont of Lucinoma myriamae]